jgi:DNA-directed RNA polymerase specialized sigma24 family protein
MANRHPIGWMSDSERALTQVAFRLPRETVNQLKRAAALAGVSQRTALKEAILDFFEKQRRTSPRRPSVEANEIRKLAIDGLNKVEIAQRLGVSEHRVYRALAEKVQDAR